MFLITSILYLKIYIYTHTHIERERERERESCRPNMNESFGSNNNHSFHTTTAQVYFHVSCLLKKDNASFNALPSICHVIGAFISVLLCKCFFINNLLYFVVRCIQKASTIVIWEMATSYVWFLHFLNDNQSQCSQRTKNISASDISSSSTFLQLVHLNNHLDMICYFLSYILSTSCDNLSLLLF